MIRNEAQFNRWYEDAISNAVYYVVEKVLEKYGQYIERYVYKGYKPAVYERTGQFKESLTMEPVWETHGGAARVYQDVQKMEYNPQEYQHGSPISGDVRDSLAKILYEGLTGPLFGDGEWRKARDAWTPLIERLDHKLVETWFIQGMAKQGINVKRR